MSFALLPAAAIGLVGGCLVGLTGVGAGSVIAALLLVAYPAVPTQVIVGSATVQAVVMKVAGVWARRQFQLGERWLGIAMAAGAIPLAVVGAWASSRIAGETLRPIVSFVLLVVGGNLVVQSAHARWRARDGGAMRPAWVVSPEQPGASASPAATPADPAPERVGLLGAGVGFIAGLTSIGTGTLFVSALAGPLGVAAHRAVGAALLAGVLTLLVSGGTHLALGHVDPVLVLGTCLGSVPGVLIGTSLSHRLQAPALRGLIGSGIMVAAFFAIVRVGK